MTPEQWAQVGKIFASRTFAEFARDYAVAFGGTSHPASS